MKGQKEFQELYDLIGEATLLALDLAQNLSFRFEWAKDKNVQEEDVHMAYGLAGQGRKYLLPLMEATHNLAKALGWTREDYIDNADERRGRGNVNIHILGEGRSKNFKAEDLFNLSKEEDNGR